MKYRGSMILLLIVLLLVNPMVISVSSSSSRSLTPYSMPVPVASVPPPDSAGCYHYTNETGWVPISCGPQIDLPVPKVANTAPPPPSEGGNYRVYGGSASTNNLNRGEVLVDFSVFTAESDSNAGSNAWSIQTNTNTFVGGISDRYWVQFTEQNDPSGGYSEACVWQIDVTVQQYHSYCVSLPIQYLSLSYEAYVIGTASTSTYLLSVQFCNYNTKQCWTRSIYDNYGLIGSWNQVSGTILGLGGGSKAQFTSSTDEQTFITLQASQSFSTSIVKTTVTGEQNNLNYQSGILTGSGSSYTIYTNSNN
ncbi:MAG: hypothetical protein ACRECH_05275 [Nitrososphaerales archaeon]